MIRVIVSPISNLETCDVSSDSKRIQSVSLERKFLSLRESVAQPSVRPNAQPPQPSPHNLMRIRNNLVMGVILDKLMYSFPDVVTSELANVKALRMYLYYRD